MDQGHFNCRDYYINPQFTVRPTGTPITPIAKESRSPASHLERHESFEALEQRSRSPASQKPKFPLLALPPEILQQILSYLLPHTRDYRDGSVLLREHVRTFSAVQKRGAKGMDIPSQTHSSSPSRTTPTSTAGPSNVVWQRGYTSLLAVNHSLHTTCAALLYGTNTFLLFLTFQGIKWRFRWLLPSGLAPSKSVRFLEEMPARYIALVKRVVVHVDHVDSYSGSIKYHVGGKGLTHGVRRQVQKLVNALRSTGDQEEGEEKRMTSVHVRVSNGTSTTDALKSEATRLREGVRVNEDVDEMLEPFGDLRGVRMVSVGGAVTDVVAQRLEAKMRSLSPHTAVAETKVADEGMSPLANGVQLCVYGNDL